jgi:tRNA(Ile)-lysidine synthase
VGSAGGPEAAARTARYAALDAAADRLDAVAVLLGHTRDDQAETVLLGLARGSGPRSLAGMAPVSSDGRYRRPLLGVDHATTAAACAAEGLPVWDDPHNSDPAFTRVRIRRDVLPALTRALGPGVPEALARTAGLLREDAAALDEWAARAAASAAEAAGPDGGLAVDRLTELPTAVRRRVLRSAAIAAGCPPGELFAVHVEAVDALVVDWHGQLGIDLPAGITARRHYGRLCFDQGQRQ